MRQIFLLNVLLLLILSKTSNSQEHHSNWDLQIGASLPELVHIGVRKHYSERAFVDVGFGTGLDSRDVNFSATINHGYYFGKVNSITNRMMWSFNTGTTWLIEDINPKNDVSMFLNLFFAKELRITPKINLQPMLGYSVKIYQSRSNKQRGCLISILHFGMPKLGVRFILNL